MKNIVFLCYEKEGFDCIKGLVKKKFKINSIVTFSDNITSESSDSISYDKLASEAGIPLYKVESINNVESEFLIKSLSPAILFVVGWPEILNERILNVPEMGAIGFHASLLPEYRGLASVNWAIINNEDETGNTMFWMSSGIETGNIIDQKVISIDNEDTCNSVYEKVSHSEVNMIMDNIHNLLTGKLKGKPQTAILPLSKKIFPEDGQIQWDKKAIEIHNYIRAYTRPHTGAFTFFKDKRLFFWKSRCESKDIISGKNNQVLPGTVLEINSEGIKIACKQGVLVLKELQFEGEELLSGEKFADKHTIKKGDILYSTPRKVAVFASHYDDEVLGIGGTLIEHFKRGDEIFIYIICESSSVRYKEKNIPLHSFAKEAAYYLGAKNLSCFDYPDQRLDTIPLIELTQKIESELSRIKPSFVYTHFSGDMNDDHKIVNKAVMTACRPYNANYVRFLAVFETPSSTEWGDFHEGESAFFPNCFVNISGSLERKLRAMKCYKSEIKYDNHPRSIEALKNRASYWGTVCRRVYAEPLIVIRFLDHLNPII